MNGKLKKTLLVLLSVIFTVSMFSGCEKSERTYEGSMYDPEVAKKLESTGGLKLPLDTKNTVITTVVSSEYNLNESYFAENVRKATGVNLQIDAAPSSTMSQKLRVLIAGGEIPDIMPMVGTIDDINELGMQGAYEPITPYIDKLPNFKSIFVDGEEKWVMKSYQATDKNIYIIPGYEVNRAVNHGMLYRKDIFDKHGIKMWNNLDEFYQVLKKLKELYPDSTPFVSKNAEGIVGKLGTGWGLVNEDMFYNEETGVWKYSDIQPETREILDLLKKLYTEGLLDVEFLTTTQSAWTQKMTQRDKAFVTFDWIGRLDMFKAQTKDTIPEYDLRWANPIGPKKTVKTLDRVSSGHSIGKSKNSLLAMQLCDFLLSPAGAQLSTIGIEGESFEINKRGYATFPEIGGEDKVATIDELGDKYGMFQFYKRADKRSSYFDYTEREKEAQEYAEEKIHMEPLDPKLNFTDEEIEIKTKYFSELKRATKEFYVQYIMNPSSGDKEWNEWLKKAESLGVSQLEKVYNDAQKRYDAL